jgi:hypothetical protein
MSPEATRDRDIDFAKGFACLCMAMGHIGFLLNIPVLRTPMWVPDVVVAEISVALFFMASGMNVLHFVDHNKEKKGWGPTKTYLITNALLFVCGFAYNINRNSLGLMDLFQGIAVACVITYIPFRRKWPTWAIVVIAIELFFISFGFSVISDAEVPHGYIVVSARQFADSLLPGYPHGDLMGNYLAMLTELTHLPLWRRFLFVHFSALPWASYALIGGVIFRLAKSKWEWTLWVLFAAALLASFLLPFFIERNMVDYYCRGKADYVFRYLGLDGMLFLAFRRFYTGSSKAGQWVELIGRESFLFFIVHWIFMEVLTFPYGLQTPERHLLITALVYTGVTLVIRRLAPIRDRGVNSRSYAVKWFTAMIVFSVIAAGMIYGMPMPQYFNVNLGHMLSIPAALAFAMGFPALRSILRKNPPAKAAPAKTEAASS